MNNFENKTCAMVLTNPFKPDYRVYKEANSLVRNGYKVMIMAWDRDCIYPDNEELDGIKIERIKVKSSYGSGILKINAMFLFWFKAVKAIKRMSTAVIHCHDLDTLIVGAFFKIFYGKKVVYDSHENFPKMAQMSSPSAVVTALKKFQDWLLNYVDAIITASSNLGEEFKQITQKPVYTIGNWHNIPRLDNVIVKATRRKYKKGSKFLVTYIGSLDLSRAIIPMIEAVKLEPDIRLLICGNGTQRDAVVKTSTGVSNVVYIGEIPQAMVPYFSAASDAIYYVMNALTPMADYNAPNSLGFALVTGRPIIASDNGELGKVVRRAHCGILVKDNNTDTLRAALHEMLVDAKLAELSKKALAAGQEHYNWTKMESLLLDIYSNLFDH